MRYDSLKKQPIKSFRVKELDGGLDCVNPPQGIKDNCVCQSSNMWYNNSSFCTRPGFKGDIEKAVNTTVYGEGELSYDITDTVVYYEGNYHRIATANVFTEDYAYYIYVYLADLYDCIKPIGYMSFLRYSNDVFHVPVSVRFFNGKPQQGGGVFAVIALQNIYDSEDKIYNIYEINNDFTDWERVENYYVPTVYINGRGNKYQQAKTEKGFSSASPKVLESQNMLDGKFYAYFTSDSYSDSFRLPFNGIADEEVVCRIYSSLNEYTEWVIPSGSNKDTKTFMGDSITAIINREKGSIYFQMNGIERAIPIIGLHPENNIKITAVKEVKDGFAKIANSTCAYRENSKLLLVGGENGNTVYVSDYDNPLYFPIDSSVDVGESNSAIVAISSQQGKIIVLKEHEIYALKMKQGDVINKVSLLTDNNKSFRKSDGFTVEQISDKIGCKDSRTLTLCGYKNVWLGRDYAVYSLDLSRKQALEKISDNIGTISGNLYDKVFSAGSDKHYILLAQTDITVFDISDTKVHKAFLWKTPKNVTVQSGFYHGGVFRFLCTGEDGRIAFITRLEGDKDTVMYFDEDEVIESENVSINSSFTTKHYPLSNKFAIKSIDGIYLSLAAKSRVRISVNDIRNTDINFGFSNEDYDRHEFKSVKILPHLQVVDTVFLKISAESNICVRDIEFLYRTVG